MEAQTSICTNIHIPGSWGTGSETHSHRERGEIMRQWQQRQCGNDGNIDDDNDDDGRYEIYPN